MKLTKYQHACFTLEEGGKLLVVDPGTFTRDLGPLENVAAVVVTHIHPDHFDPSALGAIAAHNPDAVIYGHQDVVGQLGNTLKNQAVASGDTITNGPFTLQFYGGTHAVIHENLPVDANLGVFINQKVYYPGDSFTVPDQPVHTLLLPAAAPWLKISESIDYLSVIKPVFAYPTHDAILSDIGKEVNDSMLSKAAKSINAIYLRLNKPVDVDG